jgi:hypothetical protein
VRQQQFEQQHRDALDLCDLLLDAGDRSRNFYVYRERYEFKQHAGKLVHQSVRQRLDRQQQQRR